MSARGRACVASPHSIASSVGLDVLASGGNALDAAVATNLALGVVAPYLCGYGGDVFALVWDGASMAGYDGSGRAPAAATPEAARAASGAPRQPSTGPHSVTVPGAVAGWFDLLARWGSRSFAELAQPAIALARDGFPLGRAGAAMIRAALRSFAGEAEFARVYAEATREGEVLRQPDLARTIETLSAEGPDAYYRGPIAGAIAAHLGARGALLTAADLAAHRGDFVEPLRLRYRDVDVYELPPSSQGLVALQALGVLDGLGVLPADPAARAHLLIEATKLALADRDRYLTDPASMRIPPGDLLAPAYLDAQRARIDPARAATFAPGLAPDGGTAYLCAADGDGMLVSMIQSNYAGFGSGVTVPGWGVNLHSRGAFFSYDPEVANVIAPRKRTMHTLMPAMAARGEAPWLVFGSMGGNGQAQNHVQLLAHLVDDGAEVDEAVAAPRWLVSLADWSVRIEGRADPSIAEGLRARGHEVSIVGPYEYAMGHAHAIRVEPGAGYVAAADPRSEGAALAL